MEKADLIGIMLTSKKLVSIHELTAEELKEQQHQKEIGEINMFGSQPSKPFNQSLIESHNESFQQPSNKSIQKQSIVIKNRPSVINQSKSEQEKRQSAVVPAWKPDAKLKEFLEDDDDHTEIQNNQILENNELKGLKNRPLIPKIKFEAKRSVLNEEKSQQQRKLKQEMLNEMYQMDLDRLNGNAADPQLINDRSCMRGCEVNIKCLIF